jgi:ketosteroid isomerase-like protein
MEVAVATEGVSRMKLLIGLAIIAAASPVVASAPADKKPATDVLTPLRDHLGRAFAAGDVAGVMACHDDKVEKSFGPGSRLVGKAAVEASLRDSFQTNRVEFISNEVESMLVHGDVAVEQSKFAIRGTPKAGGEPWVFRGRSQVVYIRNPASPCGWSTIRELVQPES